MSGNQQFSRAKRQKKSRNSKRNFLLFASLAIVFCIILFSLIVFGSRGTTPESDIASTDTENNGIEAEDNGDKVVQKKDDESNQEEEDPLQQTDVKDRVEAIGEDDVDVKEVETADKNILRAYAGDWKPIGTVQKGPHTTNYEDNSDDRIEIKKAVSSVTGVDLDDIIEHWIGNGGDQKVIATIQDKPNSEYYRVYLEWMDGAGWKPTKVEEMKSLSGVK